MNKIIRHKQLWQIIFANFKELIREPAVLFWGIVFPILMSLGLGFAFSGKADVIRKVALIETITSTSEKATTSSPLAGYNEKYTEKTEIDGAEFPAYTFTMANEKMGNTSFVFIRTDWDKAMMWLKRGYISMILAENNGQIEYHFDPMNTDAKFSYLRLSSHFAAETSNIPENDDVIKPLTLQGTRYIDFLVPGLIAMGIMSSCMWGISYTIIERRSKKLLRRMVATPMKKSHFLIGLIAVRMVMSFIEALLLFIFAYFVFDIRIQGSIPAFITIFIAGNIAFAGIAIFASCNTSKTEIGNGLINLVVMPMMILSGVFFSYHNFPDWTVNIIQKLPLTMLTDGLRSIFIEGGGFSEIAVPSLILTATGIVFFTAGLKIFKWH